MKKLFLTAALIFAVFFQSAYADDGEQIKNQISDFSAKLKKEYVYLYWRINNPQQVNTISIDYRKAGTENYQRIDLVNFNTYDKKETRDSAESFIYSIKSKLKENGVYYFKVTLFDNNNNEIGFDQIKVGVSGIADFKLHQNNPNPFNPSTVISYELLTPGKVSLKVYNMTGKEVATLVDDFQNPGVYNFEFNANNYGELSSGIYFYKLQTNYSSDIKKMILTK
jgi:hypothetical protein